MLLNQLFKFNFQYNNTFNPILKSLYLNNLLNLVKKSVSNNLKHLNKHIKKLKKSNIILYKENNFPTKKNKYNFNLLTLINKTSYSNQSYNSSFHFFPHFIFSHLKIYLYKFMDQLTLNYFSHNIQFSIINNFFSFDSFNFNIINLMKLKDRLVESNSKYISFVNIKYVILVCIININRYI